MINSIVLKLEIIIREYGSLGVFFAALLEELIAPIPSTLVAMFSGFFLVSVDYTWWQAISYAGIAVAIPMSLGVTLGSLAFYFAAYYGGKPIILKFGSWFGLSWDLVEKTEEKFTEGRVDEIILFTLRAIPFIPSVAISAFCGLVRYPLKQFITFSFLGTLVRSFIMALVGWQVRDLYVTYAETLGRIEGYVVILMVVCTLLFLFYSWNKNKNKISVQ